MRVSHVYECPPSKVARNVFKDLISGSHAVDVSRIAGTLVPGGRLAIDGKTYDRFVEWDSSAMRRHAMHLDAQARCEALVKACSEAAKQCEKACTMQCDFVCKATDAHADDGSAKRFMFQLESVGTASQPAWLIRS